MKKIEAIIKPFKLDAIKDALLELGIDELTAIEAKSFGRQARHTGIFRGSEYAVDFTPKVKMEIVVQDRQLKSALAAITNAGKLDDDQVFVSNISLSPGVREMELQPV